MDDLTHLIPDHVLGVSRATILLLLALSPYFTRGIQAVRTGGGLRGIVSSIWLGTNSPKGAPTAADIKTLKADVSDAIKSGDTQILKK